MVKPFFDNWYANFFVLISPYSVFILEPTIAIFLLLINSILPITYNFFGGSCKLNKLLG